MRGLHRRLEALEQRAALAQAHAIDAKGILLERLEALHHRLIAAGVKPELDEEELQRRWYATLERISND